MSLLLLSSFKYLSVYVCILVLLAPFAYRHVDLLFLTTLVVASAFALFYVNPRHLTIGSASSTQRRIHGIPLLAIDLAFHWLPFVYVLSRYRTYYRANPWSRGTTNAIVIVLLYIALAPDPFVTYGADPHLTAAAAILAIAAYAALVA